MSHTEEFRSLINQMTVDEKKDIKRIIQSKISDYQSPILIKPLFFYSILLGLALIILIPVKDVKYIPLAFMAGYIFTFDFLILRFIRDSIQQRSCGKYTK